MNIYSSLTVDNDLVTTALAGQENNRQVFSFNLTYAQLVEFFVPVPFDPNADLLIQRETQGSRINAIHQYAQVDFAAFPTCGAIIEEFAIEPTAWDNIVVLTIPACSFRYLFDGQARLGGIKKLLETNPEFENISITIKAYLTQGVKIDNQLFSDWNGATSKPNKSICTTMDSRAIINNFTKDLLKSKTMHEFNQRIDYTKASVTMAQGKKLWSLNQFNVAVQTILGVTAKSAEKLLADDGKSQFWTGFLVKYFSELLSVETIKKAVDTDDGVNLAKLETVIGTAVWLKSMAVTGRVIALHLMANTEPGMKADWSFMKNLNAVDFSKDNSEWIGRCMDFRGRFQDKGFNHKAMAAYVLTQLGITLPLELELIEDEVLNVKSEQRPMPGKK